MRRLVNLSDEDKEFEEAIIEYERTLNAHNINFYIKLNMFDCLGKLGFYTDDDCLILSLWIEE